MKGIEQKVRAYSLKHIAEAGQKYIVGMLLLPPVTVYVVWEHTSLWVTLPWLVASYLVALWRYFLIVKVRSLQMDRVNGDHWGKQLTLSSFTSGCLWGLMAILFSAPDSLGVQLYIYLTVFALSSMTIILYSYWIAAYYAFAAPSLAGVFISLVTVGSPEYNAFSILTLLFAYSVFHVARNQQRLATESLELRFKQTELLDELKLQKEAAEAANISKSKFLAAASHDLRQPLHSIGLFTAVLSNQSRESVDYSMIENIDRAVRSLDSLLNSLLDISKLDAGVITPQLEHIDLNALIRSMTSEYEPQARGKGLTWQANETSAVIYSEPSLLDTILRNLITNAIRYTDTGRVAVFCESEASHVSVKIVDTGMGIPFPQQQQVFQEFFQLPNSSKDSAKGVGLGLAIVQRLVNLLQIELNLYSAPQKGTEFVLRIPIGDRRRIKSKKELQITSPHDGAGELIMVIDNNPDVLVGMKTLLKSWHYKVIGVPDERKALRAIELSGLTPSVILSDYQLEKGVTGVNVLNALSKRMNTSFDAIILTGDTSQKCILDAHNNGYKVLHKPVVPAKLRATLINLKLT